MASRRLDGELVATLPVASNLPWIAALAASLPVAAGVYVVSKVFDKQMTRLSSAVYTIGGTWNDPEVTFDRIFDDEAQGVSILLPPAQSGLPSSPVTRG
ncbi:MAG: AsmA-like C-terminal region-containing protein [Halioglobus sp.]